MGTRQTIGQICAARIKEARDKMRATAPTLMMTAGQIADIIDGTIGGMAYTGLVKGAGDAFGDAKKIPPTPDQVTAYSAFIGYPLDGAAWCDSYAQKGWKVGKTRMKDWQAAVRNWKQNGWQPGREAAAATAQKDFTQI